MTDLLKSTVLACIEAEKTRLGSYAKVATKCGVSETTMSQLRSGKYATDGDDIWHKIATALGVNLQESNWTIVQTRNTRIIASMLNNAKVNSLFIGISHRAGSGKSASTRYYELANKSAGVFRLECSEWGRREFLFNLCQCLGIDSERKYSTSDDSLIQLISDFFNQRAALRPLLILDEADKLKPFAFRTLIPLYNRCEDRLGVVILGCDHLEKLFARGIKLNVKGFDELSSRFGRKFIHLSGCTLGDVAAICSANGITSQKQQKAIFEECEPTSTYENNQNIKVVHDLRRVKRCVIKALLENQKTPVAV